MVFNPNQKRGKSTPESRGGSFAPAESTLVSIEEAHDLERKILEGLDLDVDRAAVKKKIVKQMGDDLSGQFSRAQILEAMSWCFSEGDPIWSKTDKMDSKEIAETLSRKIVDQWALSSGDRNIVANGLQAAVQREFGLVDVATGHLIEPSPLVGQPVLQRIEKIGNNAVVRAALRSQYNTTQAWLKANGIRNVTVFRGMTLPDDMKHRPAVDQFTSVRLQPASSFSASERTALSFTGGGTGSVVVVARVPASKVLSTARTGWGCLPEREVVLLGGHYRVLMVDAQNKSAMFMEDKISRLMRSGASAQRGANGQMNPGGMAQGGG